MRQPERTTAEWIRACSLVVILITSSVPAFAQSAIELPAQPLANALSQLARNAGVNILAPDSLVAGRDASALSGRMTVRDALERLLRGTGLQVEQRDDKTYVIVAPQSSAPKKPAPKADAVLPTITVSGSAFAEESGFVASSTTTATRTDTPIALTAQSIQVVTQDQLRSQQTQSVTDALNMVSGVTAKNSGSGSPSVQVRGFNAPTMVNGSRDTGSSNSLNTPMAGIDRIEVLKGADSILSGQMNPGGVVNVTLKEPTAEPVRELTVQTGSYGQMLGAIDLGGPLTQDRSLTYRFVLSGERTSSSFGDYGGSKNLYVAPSIGWKSGGTEVVVGYRHQVQDQPAVPVTMLDMNGPTSLTGRPTPLANTLLQSDALSVRFTQKLGTLFQFESKSQYQSSSQKVDHFFAPIGSMGDSLLYAVSAGEQRSFGFDTDNHVQAKFSIGPVKQTLLAGFDYSEYWTDSNQFSSIAFAPFPTPVLPIDVDGRQYTDYLKQYATNAYLQDQLTWGRLHVLASIARGTAWGTNVASVSAWSPNFGVLYELTDNVSIYANALRSFTPQIGQQLLGGGTPPPTMGRSVEAGFKFNFLDDRLNMTVAAFRSAVSNQLISIPGSTFYTLGGGQVTRGIEASVTGRVMPGLNVAVNYTYSAEQQTSDGTSLTPRHSGSLWATYDLQGEQWHGWGAGVGLQARSRYQIGGFGYPIPGQMQTDMTLYYKAKQWSATLGVKNLFDRVLYQSQAFGAYVGLQTERVFYLTGRYNF
ncbi:iron complex outermembrane receptor protein [Paraburkholderia caballeronis]|nr:iron complex outermembrane receptor protein [Paraburkholderia caballeronis]